MSTPTEDLEIDFDAIDRKVAEGKAAKTDAPKDEIEVVEAEAAPPAPVLDPDDGLAKLKKQLDDERAGRLNAEREAAEARRAEVNARTEVQGSQLDMVKSAITSLTEKSDILETRYAEAAAAGDWGAAAKVQREMSTTAAQLMDLERGKKALESAPKPQPRQPTDPVEAFAAQLTPQSAAWVRAHPEFVRDQSKNRKMLAAHQLAIEDGIKADSPEYFEAIEHTLKLRGPGERVIETEHHAEPVVAARSSGGRQTAPAAAPVSRGGTGTGSGKRTITLSAAQREVAKMNGMTDQEYARELVKIQKENEGRLN